MSDEGDLILPSQQDLVQTLYDLHEKIKSKQHLKEFNGLLRYVIVRQSEIIKHFDFKSTASKLEHILQLAQILIDYKIKGITISNNSDDQLTPFTLIDQVLIFSDQKTELMKYKFQAESMLILLTFDLNHKIPKSIMNLVFGSVFQQSPLFNYFKFLIINKTQDPFRAIQFLQSYISSTHFVDKDVQLLFHLIEANQCLQFSYKSIVDLTNLPTTNIIHLQLWKSFTELLYMINTRSYLSSNISTESESPLDLKLKSIAKFISEYQNVLTNDSSFNIPFPSHNSNFTPESHPAYFYIPVNFQSFNYSIIYILFCLFFGISNLNTSFEKRKSLKLFDQTIGLIDKELQTNTNINHQSLLHNLKRVTLYYTIIENSITEGINEGFFNKILQDLQTVQSNNQIIQQHEVSYLTALLLQSKGKLFNAKSMYYQIINQLESLPVTVLDVRYNEIYLFSLLNYLCIVESDLAFFTRSGNSTDKIIELSNERSSLLGKLANLQNVNNSTLTSDKPLVSITMQLIQLINNYSNLSIIEINGKIEEILNNYPFDNLKKFTLLSSIILTFKSVTLNENSDQKQKSSQLAFNLSKFGYSPLIRYISGEINKENSKIAKNFQQYEIQKTKLNKIQQSISGNFSHMHEQSFF